MSNALIDAAGLFILPRLRVQNANAVSGPLTWGFPSPTAFTGFVHALERRLADEFGQRFDGVGIVCHAFDPQVFQPAGRRIHVFRLTRNPVGKDGASAAVVEEGRAHMEVSLVIATRSGFDDDYDAHAFTTAAVQAAQGMRLAGGSILPTRIGKRFEARWESLPDYLDGQAEVFEKLRRRLLPGFALVHRPDLLRRRLVDLNRQADEASSATVLDALLDLTRLNIAPHVPDPAKPDEVEWKMGRRSGWLVPLPIGFAGISPLYRGGEVANARDDVTPFRFVESLYSLGQWISPHRIANLSQLLWHAESDPDAGLYRCRNCYSDLLADAEATLA